MAKGSATEQQIAGISKRIAKVLEFQLDEKIQVNPEEEDPEMAEYMYTASPALLTMAARFVKDHDIGLDIEQLEQRSEVSERLEAIKANRGKVITLADISKIAVDG